MLTQFSRDQRKMQVFFQFLYSPKMCSIHHVTYFTFTSSVFGFLEYVSFCAFQSTYISAPFHWLTRFPHLPQVHTQHSNLDFVGALYLPVGFCVLLCLKCRWLRSFFCIGFCTNHLLNNYAGAKVDGLYCYNILQIS